MWPLRKCRHRRYPRLCDQLYKKYKMYDLSLFNMVRLKTRELHKL